MPYLEPAVIAEEFATFTREEIRPAIKDDEEFLHAQAGSMSSTLRFLSNELRELEDSISDQEAVLREALTDIEQLLKASDGEESGAVLATTVEAQEAMESLPGGTQDRERQLLEISNEVLAAIDEHTDGQLSRELRRPLYRFIDTRLDAQLSMLGRTDE